jgi:hypothetical protein
VTGEQVPLEQLWRPAPRFGDWAPLAAAIDPEMPWPMVLTERPDPDDDPGGRGGRAGDQRPWRPPMPLRPSRLELLFRAGTRYALEPGGPVGDREFFGFGVDAGTAAFLDAAALTAMIGLVTDAWVAFVERHGGNLYRQQQAKAAKVIDPTSGANLIAFESGWGDGAYPTWIGRTAAGEVACFVADMLVVQDATVLP